MIYKTKENLVVDTVLWMLAHTRLDTAKQSVQHSYVFMV